jgi:hypothetical protein
VCVRGTTVVGEGVLIETTTGDKMIGIAVLYDMTAAGESLGAMCSFVATAVGKVVSMIVICDTSVVGDADGAMGVIADAEAVGVLLAISVAHSSKGSSESLNLINSRLNNVKFTDPSPVVGSQPVVALKPSGQQGTF